MIPHPAGGRHATPRLERRHLVRAGHNPDQGPACSTTELAARLGVSLAAVSQHTKALRDARLITTSRRGGSVLHVATALGRELLAGNRSVAVCP
ncbi:hypothetical protein BM536_038735 [Streptomyces phaeoluteigriseus]|uniref:HTH arsR-type domain-containing protein n=1 Tax=Streptomyces phaeoluteigriseus TaxID=114686 RepID=A0A1V6MGT0_9ACTN|nr:hypothetical protein BM536_038735 [Streptomyces phaeoluteigriseus]